jgi:hypothetical protein
VLKGLRRVIPLYLFATNVFDKNINRRKGFFIKYPSKCLLVSNDSYSTVESGMVVERVEIY